MRNVPRETQSSVHNAKEFPLGNRSAFGLLCMRTNSLHKATCQFPSALHPFKALLIFIFFYFLTASHAPRQDRVAALKSMRHLPFPSHLAHLWIGTGPWLRIYACGFLLLEHESKCHFGSSSLEEGEGAGKPPMS